ncbi:alanine-zipper protein [Xanthomonas sp. A1809]|uniref:alanine-zipper protein n=1 Tax=Xanthomonas sp. A1809 TaxID=2821275 RepID=UPI001ADAA698|nr:alanine-zipper protein [Xanthomonas sp. A1809]MBO9859379.1 hypothetical protein [Xanthomonas sp. A1809]
MARQVIDLDTPQSDGGRGDPPRTAFEKVNGNFAELYTGVDAAKTAAAEAKTSADAAKSTASAAQTAAASAQSKADAALPRTGGTVNGEIRFSGTGGRIRIDDQSNNSLTWYNWVNNGSYFWVYQGSSVPASISSAGVVTATSFNPTSSADVKDYIEGYAGDASAELDRLVVISYRLKPEYAAIDKQFVGLLAENVHDVKPDVTDGETVVELVGEDGAPAEAVTTPMNYDLAQIVALTVRAHQQKSRRISQLEQRLDELLAQVAALKSLA